MLAVSDKYEFYETLRIILSRSGFLVTAYSEIPTGLKFSIEYQGKYGQIQIEENEKEQGVRLDLSQIEDKKLARHIGDLVVASDELNRDVSDKPQQTSQSDIKPNVFPENPSEIIGLMEFGTADYFGPLIVASVHVKNNQEAEMRELELDRAKTFTDKQILNVAPKIRELCFHSIIIIANQTLNELYEKFNNLQHILAWGFARTLENTLNQVSCPYALSHQFLNGALINNVLMRKGKAIQFFQKSDAELNLAVAAAYVLAREAYLKRYEEMNKAFDILFPKGAAKKVVECGKKFIKDYGEDYLKYVAKIYFDLTKEILGD